MRHLICISVLLFFMGEIHAAPFMGDSFQIDFMQVKKSLLGNKTKNTHGKLLFLAPFYLRVELDAPDASSFVCDGEKIYYYQAPFMKDGKGELSISKGSDSPLSRFLRSLKRGLEQNKDFEKTSTEGPCLSFKMNEEFSQKMNVRSFRLCFQKEKPQIASSLSSIQLDKENGGKLEFQIQAWENKKIEKDSFKFVIPPNTNIKQR